MHFRLKWLYFLCKFAMSEEQLILNLIQPFVDKGILLPRKSINIDEFILIKQANKLIACAGFKNYENEKMSEIYCFAVSQKYQKLGFGQKLLNLCEAKTNYPLFAISKFGGDWFLKQNFIAGDLSQLPQEKQDIFDHHRNSKIFIKNVN
jgi:N-acetylglutamate synthase-like GNAT family acetyltransferase